MRLIAGSRANHRPQTSPRRHKKTPQRHHRKIHLVTIRIGIINNADARICSDRPFYPESRGASRFFLSAPEAGWRLSRVSQGGGQFCFYTPSQKSLPDFSNRKTRVTTRRRFRSI